MIGRGPLAPRISVAVTAFLALLLATAAVRRPLAADEPFDSVRDSKRPRPCPRNSSAAVSRSLLRRSSELAPPAGQARSKTLLRRISSLQPLDRDVAAFLCTPRSLAVYRRSFPQHPQAPPDSPQA